MLPRKFTLLASLVALAALGSLAFAACGDDDDSADSHASGNAEVLSAISIIDSAGIHEIDESINTDKTIPPTAKVTADKVHTILNLTAWPNELKPQANALAELFGDLSAALDGDNPDLAKAGEATKKAHDGYHEFSHEVWQHLYAAAGIKASSEMHN